MRRLPLPALCLLSWALATPSHAAAGADDLAAEVNPFIGTTNGGNVYPGVTRPFGMVAFSPEQTPLPGKRFAMAVPGGYEWRGNGVRGFSLTHVSGTGCTGAGGDIPIMPVTVPVGVSPSSADAGLAYASLLDHGREHASPGSYTLMLDNGVAVALAAGERTALGRFVFPADKPANLLFRTSDSEVGSTASTIRIDPATRTVSGSVTSGNFCGYLAEDRRESYYTLHFVARFDQPFEAGGTWKDAAVQPGATRGEGGTSYGDRGHPPVGRGAGGVFALLGEGFFEQIDRFLRHGLAGAVVGDIVDAAGPGDQHGRGERAVDGVEQRLPGVVQVGVRERLPHDRFGRLGHAHTKGGTVGGDVGRAAELHQHLRPFRRL